MTRRIARVLAAVAFVAAVAAGGLVGNYTRAPIADQARDGTAVAPTQVCATPVQPDGNINSI